MMSGSDSLEPPDSDKSIADVAAEPLGSVRPRRLLITGTDTNVGKTYVTCLIARALSKSGKRVAAYKPVCSGAVVPANGSSAPMWEDIERLYEATGGQWPRELICPQRFLAPLAPPVAARLENRYVNEQIMFDGIRAFDTADIVLIEGAGGWLSPISGSMTVADFAVEMEANVLVVARTTLGTINHTLLTVESIRARKQIVAGVVMNESTPNSGDKSSETNRDEIRLRGKVPVLGTVEFGNSTDLHDNGKRVTIDWYELANPGSLEQLMVDS
jgi:dethiobiotin synthetase